MSIKRAEPLIPRETWEKVKEILALNSARQGPMVYRAPLLQVAHCAKCRRALNTTTSSWNGKSYRYYRCPNERLKLGCDARRIPAEWLEETTESILLGHIGSEPLTETIELPGT